MKAGKRIASILITGLCLVGSCLPLSANAAQHIEKTDSSIMRATKDFETSIQGKTTKNLKTALPLAKGETVTIDAHYSPKSANVDFGLISPDGVFHYVSESDGFVYVTISIDEPGEYKFAIRNNSSETITVSGQIRY